MSAITNNPSALSACAVAKSESLTIHTLTLAFEKDPAARWLYSTDEDYYDFFPQFVKAFGGKSLQRNTAFETEGYKGVACWFEPGVHPDDESIIAVIEKTVPKNHLDEVFAIFEQMDAFHPEFPHWYLPLIGVRSESQGNGYGSALLSHTLDRCDAEQMPAYLEASSAASVPLYEKHGFEVVGEIQSGKSPIIYPMLRQPKP